MGKIVISENMTLDGVIQDPTGEEGFKHGGWVGYIQDRPAVGKAVLEDALGAEAQLYGRRTYELLAERWPSREGALADRLNAMPKYVVSSTLENPEWNNTTALAGDVVTAVSRLKDEVEGEIVVPGSIQLVQTLLKADLVDELRLMVFPVVIGTGDRLFVGIGDEKPLRLASTHTGDDITFLRYELVRSA
jgi:dihydrofolate reductase